MKFCIHCGKQIRELLYQFTDGHPIHRQCFISRQKDVETWNYKNAHVLVETARKELRLRLLPCRGGT